MRLKIPVIQEEATNTDVLPPWKRDNPTMEIADGVTPLFSLIYQGVDISSELGPETTSITYTDNHHGKVDEIDVTVQDKDGRWKGSWKPKRRQDDPDHFDGKGGVLPCGDFEMDEPEAEGDRGTATAMTIRGLAAPSPSAAHGQDPRFREADLAGHCFQGCQRKQPDAGRRHREPEL